MEIPGQSVMVHKLTFLEMLRGFRVCGTCGVKYQWSSDGDCPNRCMSKARDKDDEQQKFITAEAEYLVLLKKLEAIGYAGDELKTKARDIRTQIIAASLMPLPLIRHIDPITPGTIAKGILIAHLVMTGIVLIVLIFVKLLR